MSTWADTIYKQKYAQEGETWEDTARRVVENVVATHFPEYVEPLVEAISRRKFMPGGRYLAQAGQPMKQYNNCVLLRAEDSREGWADLMHKVTLSSMTGAGVGICYSDLRASGTKINGNGGTSSGPIALMQMVNEAGRFIKAGGSRRAALYASLHWWHPDVFDFIKLKNWSDEIKAMKEQDFNAYAPMDGTNISVILDDDFFFAYEHPNHEMHDWAHKVYWSVIEQMLTTAEPGFQIDTGVNVNENLRNACVSGDTEVLTTDGYARIDELVGQAVKVWNGFEWSSVEPKITGKDRDMVRVTLSDGRALRCTTDHKFVVATDYRGGEKRIDAANLVEGDKLIKHEFPIIQGGRDVEYAYTQGLVSAEGMDNYKWFGLYGEKQELIEHMHIRHLRVDEGHNRTTVYPSFEKLPKSFVPFEWSVKSRLDWLAGYLDGDGCVLVEGGIQAVSTDRAFLMDVQKMLSTLGVQSKVTFRRPAGYYSLPDHQGGYKEYWCNDNWILMISAEPTRRLVEMGMNCHRLTINHLPNRDASRFVTVVSVVEDGTDETVYCFNEPNRHLGTFNGIVTGQCTEVTSEDDSDICNLGSLNLAQIDTKEEFAELVKITTVFLLCGSIESSVPHPAIHATREKNRRLGLGIMGFYEWLVKRGYTYDPNEELASWLDEYAKSTDIAAEHADRLGVSRPVKTRAIAPTGSIGILAETTTGVEPLFASAYKRRYLGSDGKWRFQYVIDSTAQRLIDAGVAPEKLESAYEMAKTPERRIAFQAWVQKWVDHGISSTLNLPSVDEQNFTHQEFGDMLYGYLPELRGVTAYPDGARGGQPLNVVPIEEAYGVEGVEFEEFGNENACVSGVCGI